MLRGSRGRAEAALAISGAARSIAHGSSAADVPGSPVADCEAGGEEGDGVEPAVGSGVLDAVESPESQPASASTATAASALTQVPIVAVLFTSAHRTGLVIGVVEGALAGQHRGWH